MVIFAQVIMIFVSSYYISLITESLKNIGFTSTSNILEKEVQGLKGGRYMPLYFESKKYIRDNNPNLWLLLNCSKAELSDN